MPDVQGPAIGWADDPAARGTEGATLGFPGGQSEMVVRPATVGTGYALTADEVRPVVEAAIARDQRVGVGACRS